MESIELFAPYVIPYSILLNKEDPSPEPRSTPVMESIQLFARHVIPYAPG